MATQPTTKELWLRFFDVDVKFGSDSPALLDLFGQAYARFQINPAEARRRPYEFFVLSQPNQGRQPFLIIGRDVWPLPEPELMPGYVFQRVTATIGAQVNSHLLFHAGAVTTGGRAVLLAGDSFHGKTTLVMELVRRGFKFLSDETAAVSRASGQAAPFPCALRVRPGSLKLAGFTPDAITAPEWFGKKIVDIEQLKDNSVGRAAPIGHVVVLRRPNETDTASRDLVLVLDRVDDEFLADVKQIKGVSSLRVLERFQYPVIKLTADRRTLVYARIESLCDVHRILMLDIHTGAGTTPNFSGPADVRSITSSQATMELLQRFQGGFRSTVLQETGPTKLFLEMTRWLGAAKCFQLTTGPLPQMADVICKLVGYAG